MTKYIKLFKVQETELYYIIAKDDSDNSIHIIQVMDYKQLVIDYVTQKDKFSEDFNIRPIYVDNAINIITGKYKENNNV